MISLIVLLFDPDPKPPEDNSDGVLAFVVLTMVMWVVVIVSMMVKS